MKQRAGKDFRAGFTLTEAAIVLGIIGIIIGAIWVAAVSVYRNQRVYHTTEQMTKIVHAVRTLWGAQPLMDLTATNGAMLAAGIFPNDMPADAATGTVLNLWGGTIVVAPANATGTMGDGFSVSLAGVPVEGCTQLFMRWAGSQTRDAGLVGAGNAVANNTSFPLALSDATGLCGAAANNVVFTFRLRP